MPPPINSNKNNFPWNALGLPPKREAFYLTGLQSATWFAFQRAVFAGSLAIEIVRRYNISVMESIFFGRTSSPVGPLFLAASSKGLLRLEFQGRVMMLDPKKFDLHESAKAIAPYIRELDEYFSGERRDFSMPIDLRGTPFQLACWRALVAIPYGETRSYAEIARIIGHPKAFRAVGMANNRNPIAIVVPCHRVIATGGSLCGYGGGLDVKRWLLDLEQAHVRPCLPLPIGA